MIGVKKRGLSPVIATVLLVSLALILAVIIFLWARAFIPESITKDGRQADQVCAEVGFTVEAFYSSIKIESKVHIENTGPIPIYGVEIRKKRFFGDIKQPETFPSRDNVYSGQTKSVDLPSGIEAGDEIIVIPMVLGETGNGGHKTYPCDEEDGQEITVQEIRPS